MKLRNAVTVAALLAACGIAGAADYGNWPSSNPNPNPTRKADRNADNRLGVLARYSGKNYHVAVGGTDLVRDVDGDKQADAIEVPVTVTLDIPSEAKVEAVYLFYTGSVYLSGAYNEVDDTPDSQGGGEAALDSAADAAANEIDINVNGVAYPGLTPGNAGGNSKAHLSWWKMHAKAGTLRDSKLATYTNRLDITQRFEAARLAGSNSITIERLQRADFAGNKYEGGWQQYTWPYFPEGRDAYGNAANNCASGATASVVAVYSLGEAPARTVTILDGSSWAWNNDFATNMMKSHAPISDPLALDVSIPHAGLSRSAPAYVYVGATLSGEAWRPSPGQCGHAPYDHGVGQDYTWVKSGNGSERLYFNIYEAEASPDFPATYTGRPYGNYPNITSVAKGSDYNITRIELEDVPEGASSTLLHIEGDSDVSTTEEQHALVFSFVVLEGAQAGDSGGDNEAPTVSLEGVAAGSTVTGSVQLQASAGDNIAVTRVDFLLDGAVICSDDQDPYLCALDSAGYADGGHELGAWAYDAAGNRGSAAALAVTFSNEPEQASSCVTASMLDHVAAERAYYSYYSYYATGSRQYLGSSFLDKQKVLSLEETQPGSWQKVSACP